MDRRGVLKGSERRLTPLLADAARGACSRQRIPGSMWATNLRCDESLEYDDGQELFACGMGHVPRKSGRILSFFTQTEP